MSELSVHHIYLAERGWVHMGSNNYQKGTRLYSADEAYDIETGLEKIGIKSKKIKIKGGDNKPKNVEPQPPQINGGVVEKQNEGGIMAKVVIKPWEDKDIERLKELFPTKTLGELAQELGRPEGSVRNKIWALRLKKNGKPAPKVDKPTKAKVDKPKAPKVEKAKKAPEKKTSVDLKKALAIVKKLVELLEKAAS